MNEFAISEMRKDIRDIKQLLVQYNADTQQLIKEIRDHLEKSKKVSAAAKVNSGSAK